MAAAEAMVASGEEMMEGARAAVDEAGSAAASPGRCLAAWAAVRVAGTRVWGVVAMAAVAVLAVAAAAREAA